MSSPTHAFMIRAINDSVFTALTGVDAGKRAQAVEALTQCIKQLCRDERWRVPTAPRRRRDAPEPILHVCNVPLYATDFSLTDIRQVLRDRIKDLQLLEAPVPRLGARELLVDGHAEDLDASWSLRFVNGPDREHDEIVAPEPVLYKDGKRVTKSWSLKLDCRVPADPRRNANTAD